MCCYSYLNILSEEKCLYKKTLPMFSLISIPVSSWGLTAKFLQELKHYKSIKAW